MASTSTCLEQRSLTRIEGEDAAPFLQALLTCDIDHISAQNAIFGALLSPQGKILFDLFISRQDNSFLIETGRDQREALMKRLTFYKLRAKVSISAVDDLKVFALWGELSHNGFQDPRYAVLGRRHYASVMAVNASFADYETHRLLCAVPEAGQDYPLGDTFPHDANYDLLHGVDFNKGCYIGQEVVSRMQHKTDIKKRIIPFTITGDFGVEKKITANGISLGTIGSHTGTRALGMVRLDKLRDAMSAGAKLTCGEAVMTPLQPEWAKLPYGGAL